MSCPRGDAVSAPQSRFVRGDSFDLPLLTPWVLAKHDVPPTPPQRIPARHFARCTVPCSRSPHPASCSHSQTHLYVTPRACTRQEADTSPRAANPTSLAPLRAEGHASITQVESTLTQLFMLPVLLTCDHRVFSNGTGASELRNTHIHLAALEPPRQPPQRFHNKEGGGRPCSGNPGQRF